jgi:prepilin-type N-terminal cleavage/methylation domain-containing protein
MNRLARGRRCAAFTLFEMVVVMVIFVLMAGGIYTAVQVAVRASATLAEENLRTQQVSAMVSLLRRTFHNLPATAVVSGGVQAGSDGVVELVLADAPGIFAWGIGGTSGGTAVLAARRQVGGARVLSLLMLPSNLSEMERREAVERGGWLPLLPDLRTVRWRFFNPDQQDWVEEWLPDTGRPPLVELSLVLLDEAVPRTYVFWVPPVKAEGEVPAGVVVEDEGEAAP